MRTLDVIEYAVAHSAGVQAIEIAAALSIPVSSLSYLLGTLCDRGYLRRDGRRYFPGPGLDRLRMPVASIPIEERITPLMKAARIELNETVSFIIRREWEAVVLVTEASGQSLRYAIDAGQRRPLHCLAAGKILLASLPQEELDRYFAESVREQMTDKTVVGEAALRAEIRTIQEDGFAFALEESTPGVCSMATAVSMTGHPVTALSIAVPTVRFTPELQARARVILARTASAVN